MLKTCQFCGKVYKTYYSNSMFCSIQCSNHSRRFIKRGNEIVICDDYAILKINSPKFGCKDVLIDLEDVPKVKLYTWCLTHGKDLNHYVMTKTSENTTIKLHRYLMNCSNNMVIDHVNHNPLDNRKSNLRICTRCENNQNISVSNNNKLGYSYITKVKYYDNKHRNDYETYLFQIRRNGIRICHRNKSLEMILSIRNDFLKDNYEKLNISKSSLQEILKQSIK